MEALQLDEQGLRLLSGVRLDALCQSERFRELDKLDAYYRGRQYSHLQYDWDGHRMGYGGQADIRPGWFVTYKHRRPSFRVELARLIVSRFSAMLLGEDRFPSIKIEGDSDAEDYVDALIRESKLRIRLQEARDKGGAAGTAVVSFGFVEGRPRVHVHYAKHCHALQWADRYEHRPAVVLKAYQYPRAIWKSGKQERVPTYYARLWTEESETIWDPIPEELAKSGRWLDGVQSYTVRHDYGECPVYWAQNLPDSDREDGYSDFDGLCDDFDEINQLWSATSKGCKANVDPTLVVHADPAQNRGAVRTGSDNAIFSEKGAEYLELRGDSIKVASTLAREQIQLCLDVAGVVLGDPDKLSGAARSAAALKILYQPMINQCDKLRAQYGEGLLVPLLQGMLRAARRIGARPGGRIVVTEDGRRLQERPALALPPRVDESPDGRVTLTERNPGTSERIQLRWPPYFKPSASDVQQAVTAASEAASALVSQATATRYVAPLFGIDDVDGEVADMAVDEEDRAARFPGPDLPASPVAPENDREGEDDE